MVKLNLTYIVVGAIILAFLLSMRIKKKGTKDTYSLYSYITGGNGDRCLIKNGQMICKDKGVFPAWFGGYGRRYGYGYPYYYNRFPYYGYGFNYPYSYGHHGGHHGGRHRRWGKTH